MKMTYVIGYRHSDERYKNLTRTMEWLMQIPNIDVVIVEQDTNPKFINSWGVNYIFAYNPLPYNRSWAFNIAYRDYPNDYLAFGDSDLVMDTNEFINSFNKLSEFDVVSPYKSVLDLTPDETEKDLVFWKSITRPGRGETDNQKINLCGGLVFFTKQAFEKVGGWNEDFIGWGGEDDFQTFKVNSLGLRTLEMPYRIYHLYHNREIPDMRFYQRNLMILQQIHGVTTEMVEGYVEKVFSTIGNKLKFNQ